MNQPLSKILSSSTFSNFYKLAEDYCGFIENGEKILKEEFLSLAQSKLFGLYSAGLQLEDVELTSDIDYDIRSSDNKIISLISRKLQEAQYYWHVFDPTDENDTEAVCGDLTDDLGDIYKDLKSSIELFNLGKEGCQEAAVWQFKFDFESHWGRHCINAIYAIHYFLRK